MEASASNSPKTFTVSEANTLLPNVKALIEQLQGLQRSIAQTTQQLDELVSKLSQGDGYPIHALKDQIVNVARHQLQLIEAFQSTLNSLQELGCELKDLALGLVDFYGMREGELVYLCWKLGEDQIHFWHTLEGGYASRQALD